MCKNWKELALAVLLGVIMPWLTVGIGSMQIPEETIEITPVNSTVQQETAWQIHVLLDGIMTEMDLSEYLTGVLLCEMPSSFHPEAKKAQAVVARTYTLRTVTVKDKHENNAVCTNPDCCQGYIAPDIYLQKGGDADAVHAATQAVWETDGLVLTYGGELIDATYFSCSGGQTEDAVAVWGADVPYLQSVSSPGEERAAHHTDTVSFTKGEFQAALGISFSGNPAGWFGAPSYTQGGGVEKIKIGDKIFTGTQLRSLLGLRSTAFTITAVGDSILITTRGYGHRVGMSQYGAEAMAQRGNAFEQILTHYYQGALLESVDT